VIEISPSIHHFHIRYWLLYVTKYKTSEHYTQLLRRIRDEFTPDGFFVPPESITQYPIGHGDENRAFFERSLNQTCLKRTGYWFSSQQQRLRTANLLSMEGIGHREAGVPTHDGVLTQEVSLSQEALADVQHSLHSLEEDDTDFAMAPVGNESDHEMDDANVDGSEVTLYSGNAYSELLPLFQQMTAALTTTDDFEECKTALHSMTSKFLSNSSQRAGNVAPQGMGSYPSVDRRRTDSRLTANSPNKRNRKKAKK
jgi:hypothetical protein